MSIKLKLALPTLIGLVAIICLIQFFWEPLQLQHGKGTYEKNMNTLLAVSDPDISRYLLESDLGALHSYLERLEKSHEGQWLNITLYNKNNKRIYPAFKPDTNTKPQDKDLIYIKHLVSIGETNLGYLELYVDWSEDKILIMKNLDNIRDMIIGLIILILMISTISQYQIIYKPLRKLRGATDKIKNGDFDTELIEFKEDEIGELTKSFNAMLAELSFQRQALDHHALVSAADKKGVITYVNNRFVSISGYSREELLGKNHRMIKSKAHTPEFYKDLWNTISRGEVWHGEVCNLKKSGEKYWVSSTIVPFLNKQGVPERYISIRTDISNQKYAEKKLKYMANHDTLTGLATRNFAKEILTMSISFAQRYQQKVALMFIDLDGFKLVNDRFGHDAGDLLLIGVAERLVKCVRKTDTVARVGGDELIIILPSIGNRENISLIAQKIIHALGKKFTLKDKTASIGLSIGISIYPDHAQDPEELIKCADDMMYVVKRNGKNHFAFYDDVESA